MEIDCDYTEEIVCPYCGYEFGDSWEFFASGCEDTEIECYECEESFVVTRHMTIHYSSHKLLDKNQER